MKIAVIGLGYVGLPLAMVFAESGVSVVGIEAVAARCDEVNAGRSYIQDVTSEALKAMVDKGLIRATTDYAATEDCDADIICLPTPLNANREPDLTLVKDASEKLAGHLRRGQLVTLESTTYPGTTRDELAPILEAGSGLTAGVDFHLAFSPERVDPGRTDYTTKSTPKVVGGLTPACTARALEVYGPALDNVVPVSTPEVAEMTKLLENIFRSVNIALMNELAMLCDRMNIDVWEVIDAAATKPFGFMKFQPGPGSRRALHPHRPVLSELEGPRVRLLDGVHRAGRQGQREHAVLLRREAAPGAQHTRQEPQRRPRPRPRRRLQGRHRRPAREPGAQGHPPAAGPRRRGRVPRPLLRGAACVRSQVHRPRRVPRPRFVTTRSPSSPRTRRSTTGPSSSSPTSSSTSATPRPASRAPATSGNCKRGDPTRE